jgi:deoxyribose-phosphate aldolase
MSDVEPPGAIAQSAYQRLADLGTPGIALFAPGAGARPAPAQQPLTPARLAAMIDHTLLKPEALSADIVRLCEEARRCGFASVCVNPCWTALAASMLRGTGVAVSTVVGFPLGATLTSAKRAEAAEAVKLGARELDMVINLGALRGGDYGRVRLDIAGVAEVAYSAGARLKVILETALLDDEQKAIGCLLAAAAGADFVKTSTGFGPGGATEHDVALMRLVVGSRLGVKAAGGIRTLSDARKMIAAGATRLGASAGVKIIEELSH